ncbi:unnamed protein product (macronuclear) [Paramecium tetraurelia]|uniref:Uncharacterized protein n=1 Tax=Paramecium tetraurelia TaxID=5888 RepID=A0EB66_PARTE|nr:uncharacterized protein GSPATT00025267001 [Paramecium tetraurelia]CAK92533.1 unnamed protein product [Paramecium tetraurelia]|eukprot:XP_001459930.1 hypothetical protein (macronuclear) [Paramecium tetraurelia strain d4-2]
MQKSHSPQPRRTNSKYSSFPFKLPINNLALPSTTNNVQSDQGRKVLIHVGQQSSKKIKQLLQVNTRPVINPSKVQIDIEKLQIIMNGKYEKNISNTSYSQQVENTLKELRTKIDEQDNLIRLQEFKINRLQQELVFSKQQYQRMMSKFTQLDGKQYNYPQSTKLTKSQISIPQIEQMPSVNKVLQVDNKKKRNIIEKIQGLALENKKFKDEVQKKFKGVLQLVNEFAMSVVSQASSLYIQQIQSIESVFEMHNNFTKNDYQGMRAQYDILNREIQLLEQQREILYDKVISLL